MNFLKNLFRQDIIIRYDIHDWVPDIRVPEYDPLYSLRKLLIRFKWENADIDKILNSKDCFSKVRMELSKLGQDSIDDLYSTLDARDSALTYVWAIQGEQFDATFERVFSSMLFRLGRILDWNLRKNRSEHYYDFPQGLNDFLRIISKNEYSNYLGLFNDRIYDCLALDHKRSGWKLTDIVAFGIDYLRLNTKHTNNPMGSLYQGFGPSLTEAILLKVIEGVYKTRAFNMRGLLYKAK